MVVRSLADNSERTFADVLDFNLTHDGKLLVYAVAGRDGAKNGVYALKLRRPRGARHLSRRQGKVHPPHLGRKADPTRLSLAIAMTRPPSLLSSPSTCGSAIPRPPPLWSPPPPPASPKSSRKRQRRPQLLERRQTHLLRRRDAHPRRSRSRRRYRRYVRGKGHRRALVLQRRLHPAHSEGAGRARPQSQFHRRLRYRYQEGYSPGRRRARHHHRLRRLRHSRSAPTTGNTAEKRIMASAFPTPT